MCCTWPVTQLPAPASSCHAGRGALATASPLPLREGTVLLCWKDPAAWEPSRDTHEYKVLWSKQQQGGQILRRARLWCPVRWLSRSQSLTVKQWKMKSKNLWARCTKITTKEKSAVHWGKHFPSFSTRSGKKLTEQRKASQEIQPLLPTLPMMWLGNSCSLSEPSFLHSLQNRKCCPTNLIYEMAKNQLFTSVGHYINSMHYCKESRAVFSLFKLQQTPLFLLLLLFPRSSGSAITCAFSKHRCWDEGQWAAGGSLPNPGTKLRLLPAHSG